MEGSLVQQWRDTQISPYVSPNLARAYHARKYAQFLKEKAQRLERTNQQVKERMLKDALDEDRALVEHHVDMYLEEQYNTVILPLVYQAMQVEQTVDELLLSADEDAAPSDLVAVGRERERRPG